MKHFYTNNHVFSREINEPGVKNEIICGDSLEVLRDVSRFPDNCIDLIVTSPPYNFGMDYDEHADDQDWESYFDRLFETLSECVRVLKFGGRLVINIQPLFSDYVPSHHFISSYLTRKEGMIWRGEILWEKNHYNCNYTAWGSWKSPSNCYLKYTWEFLEVFCKGDLKKEPAKLTDGDLPMSALADIDGDDFKEWVYAKWSIAPEREMSEWGHPAMFPEELAKRVIQLFSFKGDLVLDPFNGLGTTCAVAESLDREWIGIDLSGEYCDKARNRIQAVTDRKETIADFFT